MKRDPKITKAEASAIVCHPAFLEGSAESGRYSNRVVAPKALKRIKKDIPHAKLHFVQDQLRRSLVLGKSAGETGIYDR
jgi:hypothetical protein